MTRNPRGFTLVEFVIGIVFVGVVLGPLLLFVTRIHNLNSAIGQQGRREAWRSFNDQIVAAGIDAGRARGFSTGYNVAVPNMPPITVTPEYSIASVGREMIQPLRIVPDPSVAEPRIVGSGYQLGPGAALPSRLDPVSPLAPIIMPAPVVTPVDGTVIPAASLTYVQDGEPHRTDVQARSGATATVKLLFNSPHASVEGIGSARREVTALDLLGRVHGVAWAEYTGNAEGGDRPVELQDGRTRWHVRTTEGRQQIYEPSVNVRFAYRIGLGAPVLTRGAAEHSSGAVISFDYGAYAAAAAGETSLKIDFPQAIKRVFGNAWSAQTIGYQWTFQDVPGPFSGDISPFFRPDAIGHWEDSVALTALPVLPPGGQAETGTWTFSRVKTELGVPVLATAAEASGVFAPGRLEFAAPAGPDGVRIGRLSFLNGTLLSTGPTLSVPIAP